jgi:hypothetical protein
MTLVVVTLRATTVGAWPGTVRRMMWWRPATAAQRSVTVPMPAGVATTVGARACRFSRRSCQEQRPPYVGRTGCHRRLITPALRTYPELNVQTVTALAASMRKITAPNPPDTVL